MYGLDAGTLSRTVFDVAIVGAGPAGSVTALLCARAGLDTLLLERATFPRPKPCGDCLSPALTRILERHQLLQCVLDADPAHLAGWRIIAPSGHDFQGRFCELTDDPCCRTALAISRDRLDAALVTEAVRAGATLLSAAHVTRVLVGQSPLRLEGRHAGAPLTVRARHVVGADGLRSVVARAIGAIRPAQRRLRKISLTSHVTGVRGIHAIGEMHVADGLCLGIAPVNGAAAAEDDGTQHHRAAAQRVMHGGTYAGEPVWNVTLVASAGRFGRAIATAPARFLADALASFPALEGRLDGMRPTGPAGRGRDAWILRSGPFDVPTRRTRAENVALVGDAAGYYDPFTGQGLYQALAGAERLASALVASVREPVTARSALRGYALESGRMRRGPHLLQHAVETVMSRPRIASSAISWLAVRPRIVNALLAATGDLEPVRSLFTPSMLRAFARST